MHSLDALCESLRKEFDSALVAERQTARGALSNQLNELLRRLRSYKGEQEWISLTLDGTSLFATECALFSTVAGGLNLRGCRGIELAPELKLTEPLPHAMEAAVHSQDAVIALRTQPEVGSALSSPGADRVLVMPVLNADRVVAVLVGLGPGEAAIPGIELVAGVAGLVLERRANTELAVAIQPAAKLDNSKPQRASSVPAWSDLGEDARLQHVRAQRFARTRVAEIQLTRSDAARAGREQGNLYLFLKEQINAARENYRAQYMQDRSMLDYLHLELVNALADGDEVRLGDEYPGPLQ
jgi:hypothetical protein